MNQKSVLKWISEVVDSIKNGNLTDEFIDFNITYRFRRSPEIVETTTYHIETADE